MYIEGGQGLGICGICSYWICTSRPGQIGLNILEICKESPLWDVVVGIVGDI